MTTYQATKDTNRAAQLMLKAHKAGVSMQANGSDLRLSPAFALTPERIQGKERRMELIAQRERILKAAAQESHNNHPG